MSIAAYQGVCPTCRYDHSEHVTALASGSGDHAELARSIGKAIDNNIRRTSRLYSVRTGERRYGVGGQAEATDAVMAIVSPLLAEIAALRGERDQLRTLYNRATDRSRHWEITSINADNRATEAERKLAEAVVRGEDRMDRLAFAVQLLRDYVELTDGGHDVSALNSETRTFLSKEAERG